MKLRSYQDKMVTHLMDLVNMEQNYFALFWQMRVGKSPTILTHLENLRVSEGVKKVLILAPPSAIPDWEKHIIDWAPHWCFSYYRGNKKVLKHFNDAKEGLFLMSYHITRSSLTKRFNMIHHSEFKTVDVVIADESHKIKNVSAGCTKFALGLSKRARFRYILTGTPRGRSEVDYYAQLKFLSPEILDDFSLTQFRRGYFLPAYDRAPQGVFDEDCREEFDKKLKRVSSALNLEDVREFLPKVQNVKVCLDPTPEQAKMTAELKRDFITMFGEEKVTATSAGAALQRFLQVANGHCKVEGEDNPELTETRNLSTLPKIAWLRDNIEQLTETTKVVIWCIYQQDWRNVRGLLDEMRLPYVHYKSGATTKERGQRIARFSDPEGPRIFIAHQDSAGTGVNLSVASTMIVYSRNYNFMSYTQAMSRNVTVETRHLAFYHLVTTGTIDETVYEVLQNTDKALKKDLAKLLLRGLLE